MLMKLTPTDNFANILRAAFLYKSATTYEQLFSTYSLCLYFLMKRYLQISLVKLTPTDNFTNTLNAFLR